MYVAKDLGFEFYKQDMFMKLRYTIIKDQLWFMILLCGLNVQKGNCGLKGKQNKMSGAI